jgi:hypothetical protein
MTHDLADMMRQGEPVAVITETTDMTSVSISSAKEVEEKLTCTVSKAEDIALAEFA